VEKAKASPGLIGRDLTREVMPLAPCTWELGLDNSYRLPPVDPATQTALPFPVQATPIELRPHVVALDFGMKRNILGHLVEIGCRVTVMAGSETAGAILNMRPDGIFISNGPGDPDALVEATAMLKTLIRSGTDSRGIPIFGICLGHQLLGQAFGAKTF